MKKILSFLFLFAFLAASVTFPSFRLTATAADEPETQYTKIITTNKEFQDTYWSGTVAVDGGVYLLDPAEGEKFTIPKDAKISKSMKFVAERDITIWCPPGGSNESRTGLLSGCDLVLGDENSTATITLASTNPATTSNAIYVFSDVSAKLTLNHCVVTGFKTTNGNGFITASSKGTLTLNDVEFANNNVALMKNNANIIFNGAFYAHDNALALFSSVTSDLALSFTASDYHYEVGSTVYTEMPDGFATTLRSTAKNASVKIEAHKGEATVTGGERTNACACGKILSQELDSAAIAADGYSARMTEWKGLRASFKVNATDETLAKYVDKIDLVVSVVDGNTQTKHAYADGNWDGDFQYENGEFAAVVKYPDAVKDYLDEQIDVKVVITLKDATEMTVHANFRDEANGEKDVPVTLEQVYILIANDTTYPTNFDAYINEIKEILGMEA